MGTDAKVKAKALAAGLPLEKVETAPAWRLRCKMCSATCSIPIMSTLGADRPDFICPSNLYVGVFVRDGNIGVIACCSRECAETYAKGGTTLTRH